MDQLSFTDAEFNGKRRTTRRERFLQRMDALVPWSRLEALIEPHYPKAGNGRRPYPLATMLRIHCLQPWYSLSDPAAEDALYEMTSMRQFAGLSLDKPIPDHTTIMNFRHLLEKHHLGRQLFANIHQWLEQQGVSFTGGTIMDATIIAAPSSTKNKDQARDPEMHQTKKGNEWHFGMTSHIGVDGSTGFIHSLTTTAANVHDLNQAEHLLHGQEKAIYADAGYRGIAKRKLVGDDVLLAIAKGPSELKALKKHPRKNKALLHLEYGKSSIRAKVEHPFHAVKNLFGFRKTRYRGLAKNDNKLAFMSALVNINRLGQLLK